MTSPPVRSWSTSPGWLNCIQRSRLLPGFDITTERDEYFVDVATMASSGNSTATLVNHLEYNAFGTSTSQTNSAYQPLQSYTGQIQDSATRVSNSS